MRLPANGKSATFVGGHFKDYQRLGYAAINVLNDFTPLVVL
jgi:DNA polymerase-4